MANKIILKPAGKLVPYKLFFVPVLLIALFIFSNTCAGKGNSPNQAQNFSQNKLPSRPPANFIIYRLFKWITDIPVLNEGLKHIVSVSSLRADPGIVSNSLLRDPKPVDTIPFNFIRRDSAHNTRYLASGILFISADSVSFSLNDSLILNYKNWKVSAGNRISYTARGILVTNFLLSSDSANISAVSRLNIAGSPIDVDINNFSISDIAGIFGKDSVFMSGLLNAKAQLSGFGRLLRGLTATASIRNFQLMQEPVGNLQLSAQMMGENSIHGTVDLTENGNDVNMNGNIVLSNGLRQLDALVNIKTLQVAALKGLMKNKVNLTTGTVNGLITLKGKLAYPEWSGLLNFDTTRFILNQFGTSYTIDKQKISLDYPAIGFSRFIIQDTLGHSLVVNGNLCAGMQGEYKLGLDLNAHDFILINAPKAINNQVYGYAAMDAKISVTGNTRSPVMSGDIHLNEKTDITQVLPEKNTNKDAARSVVRFIKRDKDAFPQKEVIIPPVAPNLDLANLFNYKFNITADKQAALTIVIDPTTGDELKVKGAARLSASSGAPGHTDMSGTYRLDSGYYELNYQFLRKRFNLMPGSTIDFNGDPSAAQINIKAEYIASTAAKDLLGNEVGQVDPKIARSFNQKIPFRVVLSLKGSLNNPAISFNIELPQQGEISRQLRTTIENKLVQLRTDIAATNKQVFALLVLERFVGEQSMDFFKGNGSGFSDIAKESVSKFLSSALDQIASDLFKGINVDLNLNSYKDFTNNDESQKTDLNIEVSKNFLNDRLSVAVGRNFGIESMDASTKASQQKASRFLPDVTVHYKLSTDGKYMLRSYKKSPYEVVLDGYVVETGLSFIVTMDYDMFNELFYKKK